MKRSRIIIGVAGALLICVLLLLYLKANKDVYKGLVAKSKQYKNLHAALKRLKDGFDDNMKIILIKLTTPEENLNTTKIPVYSLWVKPKKLDILNFNLPQSGRNYVSGEFEYLGRDYKAKFRYRGDMPWHWGSLQRSWRIRFPKDNLFEGRRDINLNNPEREVIDEALEFWLAGKMGLLTPDCRIVHVRLNGQYLGVFLDIESIDQYFLKNHNQEMGSIYFGEQGDMPYENYVNVWKSAAYWSKRASVDRKAKNDTSDLSNFIRILNSGADDEFKTEIQKIIYLEEVLSYIAFVDICASEHIGNINNNRLYFVPSTGKLKLIPWDVAGHWTEENAELVFDRKKNDFWLKLLDIPEFREQKNRILWKSLHGAASVDSQINFIENTYNLIRDDVYSDKYKDTYFLRPMTNADFERRVSRLKDWVRKRNIFLIDILNASKLYVFDRTQEPIDKNILKKLEFVSMNESGILVKSLALPIKANVPQDSIFELWYDKNRNSTLDDGDMLISKSAGSVDFNVMRILLNGIEIVEPPGYTRAQYKWMDQVPRLLPSNFYFFITSAQGNAIDNVPVAADNLKKGDIAAENSITGAATEIVISSSAGYGGLEGIDPAKLVYNKGRIVGQ